MSNESTILNIPSEDDAISQPYNLMQEYEYEVDVGKTPDKINKKLRIYDKILKFTFILINSSVYASCALINIFFDSSTSINYIFIIKAFKIYFFFIKNS